jgi:hypothetical protein
MPTDRYSSAFVVRGGEGAFFVAGNDRIYSRAADAANFAEVLAAIRMNERNWNDYYTTSQGTRRILVLHNT